MTHEKTQACRARSCWIRGCFGVAGTLLATVLAFTFLASSVSAAQQDGWSEDLLSRLLDVPEATGNRAAEGGMVLRAYQMRALRLGESGRATNLVSILKRMLPSDSRVTEDRPANTLHILSTVAAQEAALEFISAMDSELATHPVASQPAEVPEEVRTALVSLANARPDAEQLVEVLEKAALRSEERMASALAVSQSQSQESLRSMLTVGAGATVVVVSAMVCGAFLLLKRAQKREIVSAAKRETGALALLPAQGVESVLAVSREQQERSKELQSLMESFSIAYQADRQRNSLMLENVAKKHGELSATLDQMVQLRREIGENAGQIFLDVNRQAVDQIIEQASAALKTRAEEVGLIAESASRKMEETASRLEVQNARAEALADELERTQREVDGLFDKLKRAQEDAHQAQEMANEQRRIAYEKTAELARKEAALAGLSLLIQEPMDSILETLSVPAGATPEPIATGAVETGSAEESASPTPDVEPATSQPSDPNSCTTPTYTFRISPAA